MIVATSRTGDQAQVPAFRLTLFAQAAAAAVFGVIPLVATAAYASALGFSGADPLVYRLGAAATFGYFVAPALAIAWHASWTEIRIPAVATLTFTIGALAASGAEYALGARQLIVPFVAMAATAFTVVAAYWIRRDEGEAVDAGRPVGRTGRIVLVLASLSAGTFGLLPLIAPAPFSTLFGLEGTDSWVFRLAGAGCLGYATAGVASLLAPGYRLMRIQNGAAIAFNGLGAISAWLAVASGSGGWLAPVVAVAATFFAIALLALDRRLAD